MDQDGFEKAALLLSSEKFAKQDPSTSIGLKERVALAETVGAPRMMLLSAKLWMEHGNNTNTNTETETETETAISHALVPAIEVYKKPGTSVFFVSASTDISNNHPKELKNALGAFATFYSNYVEFQLDPNGLYFFYPPLCLHRTRQPRNIPWIPVYMACTRINVRVTKSISGEHELTSSSGDDEDAWMALERGMVARFVKFGKTPWMVPLGFTASDDYSGSVRFLPAKPLCADPAALASTNNSGGEEEASSSSSSSSSFSSSEAISALAKLCTSGSLDTEIFEPISWGETSVGALEPVNKELKEQRIRLIAVGAAQAGLTTLLRQATKHFGTGFTELGDDRRTKTYNHFMKVNSREVMVSELGVNASGRKGLRKMLMMAGAGDDAGSGAGLDLVLFVCSLDDYDRFTDSGENKLIDSVRLFDTVQRSLKSGTPSFVVFNKYDLFLEKDEVEGMCEAMFADYATLAPQDPLDYFKGLFKSKHSGGGKLDFGFVNALDQESVKTALEKALALLD